VAPEIRARGEGGEIERSTQEPSRAPAEAVERRSTPRIAGGDREKAEAAFRKALEIDPHFTNARLDLARVLIASGRAADARRELQHILDEKSPQNVADWTVKDAPRARQLLESLKGK